MIRKDEIGIYEQIQKFDFETQRNEGQIRFDRKSGLKHKMMLIQMCKDFIERQKPFFTRARHKESDMVADFYDIEWNEVVEIQDSEADESIARKKAFWTAQNYGFRVVKL